MRREGRAVLAAYYVGGRVGLKFVLRGRSSASQLHFDSGISSAWACCEGRRKRGERAGDNGISRRRFGLPFSVQVNDLRVGEERGGRRRKGGKCWGSTGRLMN